MFVNDGTKVQIKVDDEWRESVYNYCMMKPHYPVPALQQDSCSDLGERWSSWMDTDYWFNIRY